MRKFKFLNFYISEKILSMPWNCYEFLTFGYRNFDDDLVCRDLVNSFLMKSDDHPKLKFVLKNC
jgi:hypothetical protein